MDNDLDELVDESCGFDAFGKPALVNGDSDGDGIVKWAMSWSCS